MIFTQRVYLTDDGRYVPEGDQDAAFLAYPVGAELSDRLVAERGLEAYVTDRLPAPSSQVVVTGSGLQIVRGGTNPAGHATPSPAGVPAEVAPPVVANTPADASPATMAAERSQTNRAAGKPARTREV